MKLEEVIAELAQQESSLRFARLKTICEWFFGKPRIKGDHHIFSTGLPDQPLVNIQPRKGKTKAYQIRQVKGALEKLRARQE